MPNVCQRFRLVRIFSLCVVCLRLPSIYLPSKDSLAVSLLTELVELHFGFSRFKALLVPLLQCDLHLVVTQLFHDAHKSLECAVTALVKATVGEEFVEGFLFARPKHPLQNVETHLGHQKFVVVRVVSVHLTTLARYFKHTIIVSAIQMFELGHEFVAFLGQPINDLVDVSDVVVIACSLSSQDFNFFG